MLTVESQKAVGIIARLKKIRLKLITTAFAEPKLRSSLSTCKKFLFKWTKLFFPFYAREVFFHCDQNNVNNPPDTTATSGQKFQDSKANLTHHKSIDT